MDRTVHYKKNYTHERKLENSSFHWPNPPSNTNLMPHTSHYICQFIPRLPGRGEIVEVCQNLGHSYPAGSVKYICSYSKQFRENHRL